MRPFKLPNLETLEEIHRMYYMKVPVRKIIIQLDIDLSIPKVKEFAEYYQMIKQGNKRIKDSLFPKWLDKKGDKVQSQPLLEWTYEGVFPLGKWKEICKDS